MLTKREQRFLKLAETHGMITHGDLERGLHRWRIRHRRNRQLTIDRYLVKTGLLMKCQCKQLHNIISCGMALLDEVEPIPVERPPRPRRPLTRWLALSPAAAALIAVIVLLSSSSDGMPTLPEASAKTPTVVEQSLPARDAKAREDSCRYDYASILADPGGR